MPVTYTIPTNSYDDAIAGTIVDWTNNIITFPTETNFVDGQITISTLRLAEQSSPGSGRDRIVQGFGFYQKGTDRQGNPVLAAVDAILNNPWKIATAKTTGGFTVQDVYRLDASFPVNLKSGVNIQYTSTVGGTVVQTNTGSGLTASQADQLTVAASSSSNTETSTAAILSALGEMKGEGFVETTDSLEAIRVRHNLTDVQLATVKAIATASL